MIELYSAATPNGQKIHIMLEECGLDYAVHWIDIDRGEQFDPEFLKFSPNNKIPAIIDREAPGGAPFAAPALTVLKINGWSQCSSTVLTTWNTPDL